MFSHLFPSSVRCHYKSKAILFTFKHLYSKGLDDNEEESDEDVLLSPEDTITEETSITKDFDDDTSDDVGSSNFVADGLTELALQEKVVKFMQSGELETFEGKWC